MMQKLEQIPSFIPQWNVILFTDNLRAFHKKLIERKIRTWL